MDTQNSLNEKQNSTIKNLGGKIDIFSPSPIKEICAANDCIDSLEKQPFVAVASIAKRQEEKVEKPLPVPVISSSVLSSNGLTSENESCLTLKSSKNFKDSTENLEKQSSGAISTVDPVDVYSVNSNIPTTKCTCSDTSCSQTVIFQTTSTADPEVSTCNVVNEPSSIAMDNSLTCQSDDSSPAEFFEPFMDTVLTFDSELLPPSDFLDLEPTSVNDINKEDEFTNSFLDTIVDNVGINTGQVSESWNSAIPPPAITTAGPLSVDCTKGPVLPLNSSFNSPTSWRNSLTSDCSRQDNAKNNYVSSSLSSLVATHGILSTKDNIQGDQVNKILTTGRSSDFSNNMDKAPSFNSSLSEPQTGIGAPSSQRREVWKNYSVKGSQFNSEHLQHVQKSSSQISPGNVVKKDDTNNQYLKNLYSPNVFNQQSSVSSSNLPLTNQCNKKIESAIQHHVSDVVENVNPVYSDISDDSDDENATSNRAPICSWKVLPIHASPTKVANSYNATSDFVQSNALHKHDNAGTVKNLRNDKCGSSSQKSPKSSNFEWTEKDEQYVMTLLQLKDQMPKPSLQPKSSEGLPRQGGNHN